MSVDRLKNIEDKIKDLEEKKKQLQEKQAAKTAKLITKLGLSMIDQRTLCNALQFIKKEIKQNFDLAMKWKTTNQKKSA